MNMEKSNVFNNNKSGELYKEGDKVQKNFYKVVTELCNYNNVGGTKFIDRTATGSSNFINVNNILKEYFGEDFISKNLENTLIYMIKDPQDLYIDYKLDNGYIVNMLYFSYNKGAIYVNDNYHISKNMKIEIYGIVNWIYGFLKGTKCHPAQTNVKLIHYKDNINSKECEKAISVIKEFNGKDLSVKDNISKVVLYENMYSCTNDIVLFYNDNSSVPVMKYFSERDLVVLNKDVFINKEYKDSYNFIDKLFSSLGWIIFHLDVEFDSLL